MFTILFAFFTQNHISIKKMIPVNTQCLLVCRQMHLKLHVLGDFRHILTTPKEMVQTYM